MSLLTVIALVSLGVTVEDWRGQQAWNEVIETHASRGDPLDVLPPAPAPIPVAENFFGNPRLARLYFAKSTSSEIASLARAVPIADRPLALTWMAGESLDIAAICALIAQKDPQLKLPDHLQHEPPATRLLHHLGGANHLLGELRHAALYRTHSQPVRPTPTRIENVFKTEIPTFKFTRFTAQLLALHASASLRSGDIRTAYADSLAGLQFCRGVATSSDTLVEPMIAAVIVKTALQPVWEGLHSHTWNDAQLARFQAVLAATDIFAALHRGVTIDRNGAIALFNPSVPLIPRGWIDQNRADLARHYTLALDVMASHTSPAFLPKLAAIESAEKKFGSDSPIHPYRIIARSVLPPLHKVTRNAAFSANAARLAQTACALERHRLRHGSYPESLTALVPAYLAAVPLDIIDGAPLRYRLNPDGTFTLYSVALDGDDDKGRRGPSDGKNLTPTTDGDWPW